MLLKEIKEIKALSLLITLCLKLFHPPLMLYMKAKTILVKIKVDIK
jgi:hypothetical protein